MGSERNKMSDATVFHPSEPKVCANGCGFFGMAATMDLCSKCYRDRRTNEEQAAMEKLLNIVQTVSDEIFAEPPLRADESAAATRVDSAAKRCSSCNKKVRVVGGFRCRCGDTFCGAHRYPEKHDCTFDFKAVGREAIARDNPVVRADKVERF